jgi:hypothetical protein
MCAASPDASLASAAKGREDCEEIMIRSIGRAAAFAVCGCALGLTAAILPPGSGAGASPRAPVGAGASPRAPAAGPSWRVTKVIAVRGDTVVMTGIDVLSAGDAWVAAVAIRISSGAARPLLEHWNGRTWLSVPLPAQLASGLLGASAWASVAASAPGNVWAFGAEGRYAHLSGGRWRGGRLPGTGTGNVVVYAADVFGPADAWAFGARYGGPGDLILRPWAAHFDGRRWAQVHVPGAGGITVSAVSGDDLWAVTGVVEPGAGVTFTPTVLRWNGRAWVRAARQPRLPRHAVAAAILAESDRDVWISGAAPNREQGTSELASHWNGRSWTPASPHTGPADTDDALGSLVPDGRSGIWGLGEDVPELIWHYAGGRWAGSRVKYGWYLLQLAAVPDRTSLWALGDRRSFSQGIIIERGPLPR